MTIHITTHAKARMKGKLHVKNIHKGERIALNAWERGRRILTNNNDTDNRIQIIAYSENTFVFTDNEVLVTVYRQSRDKRSLYEWKAKRYLHRDYPCEMEAI